MRDDSFCIFIFYEKQVKISGFRRMGGISCYSTNPNNYECNKNKIKCHESKCGEKQ